MRFETVRRGWPRLGLMLAVVLGAVIKAPAQPVLLIRDENSESNYETYVHTSLVRRALRRAGLDHDVIVGDKVGFRSTRAQKLVVLPCNPSLTPRAVDWLRRTVMTGARLLVFPPAPAALADLLGLDQLGPVRSGADELLGELLLDRAAVQQLPDRWRQFDWNYQVFAPAPSARTVGRWSGAAATAPEGAALVLGRGGAFVGANLEGDDRASEAHLLLALATHWFAALWHEAVPGILKAVGQVGDANSLGQIRRAASQASTRGGRRAAATAAVNRAAQSLEQARKLYDWGKYTSVPRPGQTVTTTPVDRYLPVARLGWEAQLAAEQAYYIAQSGRPGEFRGVWLQQAGDLRSWGWERTIGALRENNIDAIFLNVVNGGYANYPSQILPHVSSEGHDPLADVLAWCRAFGVECHVWMMCNYIRPLTPAERMTELRLEGRLQETRDGRELPWLRPADPRNVQQLANVAREIALRYPVDGIHLDYIRYGHDADYSETERDAFERSLGRRLTNWPADVEIGGPFRTAWATWRQENVNRQVEAIATAVRAARPGTRISAAVYPVWTDARFKVAQDPETWAKKGWMDFLSPMNYHTDDTTFYRYLAVQQRAVGKHIPLYPGIAAWRQETPADTISQIRRLRAMDMPGYLLFHLDRRLAREWLPALRLGVTDAAPRLGPAGLDPTEVAVGGHG